MDAISRQPIASVRIVVSGTQIAAVTDSVGRFRIQGLPGGTVTLQVRRLGYRPFNQTVQVDRADVQLLLTELPQILSELVVTGTATPVEKRAIGNAVSTIDAARVQELAPAPDLSNLLNGRAAGVVITPGSGAVGSGPRIRIRGAASLSLNDQPLLYVDGVRVANDVSTGPRSQFFNSGVISRLNDIDPESVESIEIIKGPAAATLYGTEASNGVIQIITKRGKIGKPIVTATIRQGTNWFMDAERRVGTTYNRDPATSTIRAWNPVAQEEARGTPLFKSGQSQSYHLGLSGGEEQFRYNLSSSYDNDKGIEPTNHLWRYSGNAHVSMSPYRSFDLSARVGIIQEKINVPLEAGGGMWFSAFFGQAPRDANEELRRGFFSAPPEAFWNAFEQYQQVSRVTGSVQLSHRFGDWFNHRLIAGTDQSGEDNVNLTERMGPELRQFFTNPIDQQGGKLNRRRELNVVTVDYAGTVRAKLTDALSSATSFGAQYHRRRDYTLAARGEGFPAAGLTQVDATALTFGGEDLFTNSTLGFYGQEQVDINNRVFLTAALRVDDNSAFGENFSWIAYPKFSATWVITEEPWWRYRFLDALKLRAAYGQAGQQPVVNSALRTFAPVTGGDGLSAVTPQSLGNADLKAERASEIEVGFDASTLGDRLGLEFTLYRRDTKDAILLQNVSPSSGFSGQRFVNIGGIRSSGVEVQARGTLVTRENFGLDVTFNIAHNDNEVTDLGGPEFIEIGAQRNQVGRPVRSWYDRRVVSAEFDPANPGRTINAMCDDGQGGVTPCLNASGGVIAPRVYLGRPDPPTEGSFSTTATLYRYVRLYGLIDFKRGHTVLNNNARARCQVFRVCMANLEPTQHSPALIAQYDSPNLLRNFVYEDASFAKLREVSASFTFPERYARMLRAGSATLTISGRNLHTWTDYTGVDPESFFVTEQFVRLEQAQVPQLAQFMTSLHLTF
jgi:TonB-linked SusC/RagA family outer membrane protein